MTTKRDKKQDRQKATKKPSVKKETVKDLDAKRKADEVQGGGTRIYNWSQPPNC